MTSQEIRKKFLEFFENRGHKIISSSSLVPKDDPSVLLTTAGMQQFKLYFTGAKDPVKDFGTKRVASIQKSFRTSDIDEVGDESHLTFFEMLGNFSFGDYFKEDAIKFGWEFITKELCISSDRCYVSVFKGDNEVPEDKESIDIWKSLGLSDDKIKKAGREDNFWGPTGNEGPCGPTSEIYVDGIEVWNLVFNQYYCHADGTLEPLKQNGVDTGMGLERLTMVMQNKRTIFKTDLFDFLVKLIPHHDIENENRAVRIIVDHIRGSVFLIADGIFPSNMGAGYILRRLLRRAIRYGKILDAPKNFLISLSQKVIEMYKEFYPDLSVRRNDILTVIEKENEKFGKTLEKGLKELKKLIEHKKSIKLSVGGFDMAINTISGKEAFQLYESYGFPLELIKEMSSENGFDVDELEFKDEAVKHQKISRAGAEKKFGGHGLSESLTSKFQISSSDIEKITRLHTATHLLNQTLHDVLGKEADVKQMGSDITPERTRFDFTFPRKLTSEEIKEIENIVNEKIKMDLPVYAQKMPREKALKLEARAFFKEKYPDEVNVYSIGDPDLGKAYSKELCGGPHVKHTGEIGKFRIIKEESSSAGVRRIRAVVE